MKTVYCPVMKKQIDGTTCLEIVLVADNEMKPQILPVDLEWNATKRNDCLCCMWHSDLKYGETVEDRKIAFSMKKM